MVNLCVRSVRYETKSAQNNNLHSDDGSPDEEEEVSQEDEDDAPTPRKRGRPKNKPDHALAAARKLAERCLARKPSKAKQKKRDYVQETEEAAEKMERMSLEQLEEKAHDDVSTAFAKARGDTRLVVGEQTTEEQKRLLHNSLQELYNDLLSTFGQYVIGEAERREELRELEEKLIQTRGKE